VGSEYGHEGSGYGREGDGGDASGTACRAGLVDAVRRRGVRSSLALPPVRGGGRGGSCAASFFLPLATTPRMRLSATVDTDVVARLAGTSCTHDSCLAAGGHRRDSPWGRMPYRHDLAGWMAPPVPSVLRSSPR